MKIEKNSVVTLRCTMFDAQNNVLVADSDVDVSYLHGGYGEIFPRVEEALTGQQAGYEATLHLEPEDAFGDYNAERLRVEPRSKFPEPLQVGMQFEGIPEEIPEDDQEPLIYSVTDLTDSHVVLDANHPYAGFALRFALKVLHVRAAQDEEIVLECVLPEGNHSTDETDDADDDLEAHLEALINKSSQVLH